MPPNTVYVGRPTKWGNPFVKIFDGDDREQLVRLYRGWLRNGVWSGDLFAEAKKQLRGRDLACWCPLVDSEGNRIPCHADVLLEVANR